MKEAHDEYQEYKALKRKDAMSFSNEAGDVGYLVSTKWLRKYEKYVL